MVSMQREIAKSMSCILDGRDIGSFVLPDAKYKFYITAAPEVRTARRKAELESRGFQVDFHELLKEIEQRDYNDKHRDFAPLVQAKDAILIDTSDMSVHEVLEKILSYIDR